MLISLILSPNYTTNITKSKKEDCNLKNMNHYCYRFATFSLKSNEKKEGAANGDYDRKKIMKGGIKW